MRKNLKVRSNLNNKPKVHSDLIRWTPKPKKSSWSSQSQKVIGLEKNLRAIVSYIFHKI